MKKNIHFYRLVLEKTSQTNLFESIDTTFKKKVLTFINNHEETDLFQINNKNIFTLLSFDEHHLFGTFGNVSDVIKGDHVRVRNRDDLSVEKISKLLEVYTYYYLDLESFNIALLQNSKLSDFKEPFKSFISSHFRISSIFEKIEVVPLLSGDIPNIVGKSIPLTAIKVAYTDNRLPENDFLSIKEVVNIGSNDIQSASINIDLKKNLKKNFFIKQFKKKDYSELKLETDTEVIDLIGDVITKKISVEVNKDDLRNPDIIKNKLQTQLLLINNY